MRQILFLGALVLASVVPGATAAGTSSWSDEANRVCVVYTAKAKREFATPVTVSGLYAFAAAGAGRCG